MMVRLSLTLLFSGAFIVQTFGQSTPNTSTVSSLLVGNNDSRVVCYRSQGKGWKIASETEVNLLDKISEPIEIKYVRRDQDLNSDLSPGILLARWESFLRPQAENAQSENASAVEFRSRKPDEAEYQKPTFDLRPYQNFHKGQSSNPRLAKRHLTHHRVATSSPALRQHFVFPPIAGNPGSVARHINLMELSTQVTPEEKPTFSKEMNIDYESLTLLLVEIPDSAESEVRRKTFRFAPVASP